MSYEDHCNDFALYGDPEREHYDHEFNARYDYEREAFGDSGDAMQDWMDSLDDDDFDGEFGFEDEGDLADFLASDDDEDWDDVPF